MYVLWLCIIMLKWPGCRCVEAGREKALRETSIERGLEYGVRAPVSTEIYGSKPEKTVFHGYLQEVCFVLTEISGNLREFTGECNLRILYSSSLLSMRPIFATCLRRHFSLQLRSWNYAWNLAWLDAAMRLRVTRAVSTQLILPTKWLMSSYMMRCVGTRGLLLRATCMPYSTCIVPNDLSHCYALVARGTCTATARC